jgi:carbon storage regulator CsrA
MLVLSRRLNERIQFPGLNITVQVVAIKPNVVRIGIEAPPDVSIVREEILRARGLSGAYGEGATTAANDRSEGQLLEELRTLCARLSRLEQPEALHRQAEEVYHRTAERLRALTERGSADVRMRALVDSAADAIVSKTLEGVIVSWNGSAERLYGYTAQEVKAQHISLLFPPGRAAELTEIMRAVQRGKRMEAQDTVRVRKGGGPIAVSVSVSPIRDAEGRITGASAIARAIPDRKHREEKSRNGWSN